ncbi:hypothetical protein [Arthrobacter sp. ISL-28]|uniref:hypothetical protein n=1 Tax=Arthrobacter sp. ISL-28 TaxID=2819108 RepID=UPI001BEAB2A3|nr:hypothetical protein [Arthrobacter sp. ISL-28]MBT2519670.1 hypothetical protein [Arthrobacter sp. ISL-28]
MPLAATIIVVGWLSSSATYGLLNGFTWPQAVIAKAVALAVLPGLILVFLVAKKTWSLAWAIFWTWTYIFMGLAPAFQLAKGTFPWGGLFGADIVDSAQWSVIFGCVAAFAGYTLRRKNDASTPWALDEPAEKTKSVLLSRLKILILVQSAATVVFVATMGTAMFSGRSAFSSQLINLADIPAIGTLYFISTAGAIFVPAFAIYARRVGYEVPRLLIAIAFVAGFVASNPLIGSRFLTGSFLVAVVGAWLVQRPSTRWIPVGAVVLMVTVFPTLDLLRGDGTGAAAIEAGAPEATLASFDFDSFEMLSRETSLWGEIPDSYPTAAELIVAPLLRWVPFLSAQVTGDAGGPVVAHITGMSYTNVSMPLWGEAHLIGSSPGVVVAFFALGYGLRGVGSRMTGRTGHTPGHHYDISGITDAPVAALLFIVLRGSLYEVLGYLLLAMVAGHFVKANTLSRTTIRKSYPLTPSEV